jgi:hypothetical protein
MTQRWILCAALAGGLASSGCDEKPKALPPSYDGGAEFRAQPTTQNIATWPRKRSPLAALPLTIDVPDSWQLKSIGLGPTAVFSIEGLAPSGTVSIQLSSLSDCSAQIMTAMIKSALRRMDGHDPAMLMATTRDLGEAKVLEQRVVRHIAEADPGADQPAGAGGLDMIEWTIVVFAPRPQPDTYQRCVLSIYGLTREEFDQDKDFLQKSVDSLQYDATANY